MSQPQPQERWDLDSDEIASVASEDLRENRPNRWTGSKSTWRYFTEEERMLWRSMKQLQDEDLAAHLYNAFALKKRAANPESAQDLVITTEDGQEAIWAPPKTWTAWPALEKHLPWEGLFKAENDEDDKLTFRRNEKKMPSSELEEELSATILRQAKKRFTKRMRPTPVLPSIESEPQGEQSDNDDRNPTEASTPRESAAESVMEDESIATDQQTPAPVTPRKRKSPPTYDPVVSANDQLSNILLKPSVRHILSNLDNTLTVLHNTRLAGLSYLSDSSETESESDAPSPLKRGRGRPRKMATSEQDSSAKAKGTRRGRPKLVHEPQKDETPHEMQLRLARKYHRRLPATAEEQKEAAFQEWVRQGDERIAREQQLSRRNSQDSRASDSDDSAVDRRLLRWGLRDWSDVVGAAALAGFPAEVIERTTRRCADLFGQGMSITQLDEVPVSRGPGFSTRTFRPERIRLSNSVCASSSEDELTDAASEVTLSQRRMASRQVSLALSSREASSEPRGRRSPSTPGAAAASTSSPVSRSRSRSHSRSGSSAGLLFCPLASCSRAAKGFTRRANLKRHMRLVHPGHDEDAVVEEDSGEETVGAVHADGFLRTINPGKGWRGEDVMSRKRRWDARAGTPGRSPRPDEVSE